MALSALGMLINAQSLENDIARSNLLYCGASDDSYSQTLHAGRTPRNLLDASTHIYGWIT